jgi:hypothetical protein
MGGYLTAADLDDVVQDSLIAICNRCSRQGRPFEGVPISLKYRIIQCALIDHLRKDPCWNKVLHEKTFSIHSIEESASESSDSDEGREECGKSNSWMLDVVSTHRYARMVDTTAEIESTDMCEYYNKRVRNHNQDGYISDYALKVYEQLTHGASAQEVAKDLNISVQYVNYLRSQIIAPVLHVAHTSQAIRCAR